MIDTYEAFVNTLVAAIQASSITDIVTGDVSYENQPFDPNGKDAWLAVYYMPAIIDSLAKDRFDQEDGLFQLSVFVPLNDETGGVQRSILRLTAICQDVINVFYKNSVITANGVNVSILDSTLTPSNSNDSWFGKDISINYVRN